MVFFFEGRVERKNKQRGLIAEPREMIEKSPEAEARGGGSGGKREKCWWQVSRARCWSFSGLETTLAAMMEEARWRRPPGARCLT